MKTQGATYRLHESLGDVVMCYIGPIWARPCCPTASLAQPVNGALCILHAWESLRGMLPGRPAQQARGAGDVPPETAPLIAHLSGPTPDLGPPQTRPFGRPVQVDKWVSDMEAGDRGTDRGGSADRAGLGSHLGQGLGRQGCGPDSVLWEFPHFVLV